MTYITEKSEFTGDDVPLLDTSTPVKGYDGTSIGPANEQAQVLANRTLWLKDGLDKANKSVAGVVDTAEKISLKQTSIDSRLTTVEDAVVTADKSSISRDNQLESKLQDQNRTLTTNINALDYTLKQLDTRESQNSRTASDDIKKLSTTVKQVSDSNDQLSTSVNNLNKKVTSVTTDVDSLVKKTTTLTTDVDNLKTTTSTLLSDTDTLKTGVKDNVAGIARNAEDIKNLTASLGTTTGTINDNKAEIDKLTTSVSSLTESLAKTDGNVETLTGDITVLKEKADTFSTDVDDLRKKLTEVDEREASDFETLKIGLSQSNHDITQNTNAIQTLNTTTEDLNTRLTSAAKVASDANDAVGALANDVNGLSESKQDKLVSGTNINTVFGVDVTKVKDGGITLADAKDIASVMKSHLAVGSGLSLVQSEDGQTLTLDTTSGGGGGGGVSGLGAGLVIKKVSARANREYEYRAAVRPTSYNLRAYAFKSIAAIGQSDLTVNFDQNPYNVPTSPWDSDGIRISFLNDETTARWTAINTLTVDASTYGNTRMGFSVDGVNWYSYVTSSQRWVSLGELTTTKDSAILLISRGIIVKDFASISASVMQNWLSSMENPPALNVAFATGGLTSENNRFVPATMSATFNTSSAWALQTPPEVSVTITPDSVIFKPNSDGDYIFCYELLK